MFAKSSLLTRNVPTCISLEGNVTGTSRLLVGSCSHAVSCAASRNPRNHHRLHCKLCTDSRALRGTVKLLSRFSYVEFIHFATHIPRGPTTCRFPGRRTIEQRSTPDEKKPRDYKMRQIRFGSLSIKRNRTKLQRHRFRAVLSNHQHQRYGYVILPASSRPGLSPLSSSRAFPPAGFTEPSPPVFSFHSPNVILGTGFAAPSEPYFERHRASGFGPQRFVKEGARTMGFAACNGHRTPNPGTSLTLRTRATCLRSLKPSIYRIPNTLPVGIGSWTGGHALLWF